MDLQQSVVLLKSTSVHEINFEEFYENQMEHLKLNHSKPYSWNVSGGLSCIALLREHNKEIYGYDRPERL